MRDGGGWARIAYLGREPFDEDSDKKVEEDVVAERHQSDEVQSRPGRRARHSVIQHLVPVLLRQNLYMDTARNVRKSN